MVSIPFHQIMRSTCPVFTVLIYRLRYHRQYSSKTYLSLIPIVLGVGLATYGDYYFTVTGFLLTLLGVILASIKVYTIAFPDLQVSDRKLRLVTDSSNQPANDRTPLPLTPRIPLPHVTPRIHPITALLFPHRRALSLFPHRCHSIKIRLSISAFRKQEHPRFGSKWLPRFLV